MEHLSKTAAAVGEVVVHRHAQTLLGGLNLAQQFLLVTADDFRRRRRRRRAQVADKIGDSDIGFVANGANHRNAAGKNSARHAFVVKAP